MTFLPIVERELRVASRRRLTYWLRPMTAGLLLGVFVMIFLISMFGSGFSGSGWTLGKLIFYFLKWIAFIFAGAWGIFLPSDSLSEEKREGTLGLLFLTDLRGYDVVIGKLISLSLQSFYGLLAVIPILALPLMMGGVSGLEVWRTALVMYNTLFLSLAIGLFVSSMSREVLKAMNAAALLNIVLTAILPWVDLALAHYDITKWKRVLSIASPGYLFAAAPNLWPNDFWNCLLTQFGIALFLLVLACVIVPRAWQERSTERKGLFASLFRRWRFGGKRARLAFRRKWLARDPIFWLALRDHWLARLVLLVSLGAAGCVGWLTYERHRDNNFNGGLDFIPVLFVCATVLWIASQACRFNLEAVRSGAMELILVTPVPARQIVHSQKNALLRTFLIAALLLLCIFISDDWQTCVMMKKAYLNQPGNFYDNWLRDFFAQSITGKFNFIMLLIAMGWFGMWMGLTNRKLAIAVVKTILFVVLIPIFLEIFLSWASQEFFSLLDWPSWLAILPVAILEFAKNIFFILWSRKRLMTRFRETVAQTGGLKKRRFRFLPRTAQIAVEPRPLVS